MSLVDVRLELMLCALKMRALTDWILANIDGLSPREFLFYIGFLRQIAEYARIIHNAIHHCRPAGRVAVFY